MVNKMGRSLNVDVHYIWSSCFSDFWNDGNKLTRREWIWILERSMELHRYNNCLFKLIFVDDDVCLLDKGGRIF